MTYYYLSVALAIGLLIGVERGWKTRDAKEGTRIAGVRTYGLIGLLGGSLALLSVQIGSFIVGLGFVGMAGILAAVYVVNLHNVDDGVGITSLVTGLLTFVFGALAGMGEVAIAAAFAVVTTLLLSYKPLLHRWVNSLESKELNSGIQLLLISVVLLPILPNHGYGPWQSLNPFVIWWMVVFVAALSFVGYFTIKIAGPRRGVFFTGLFGGMVSSTALTLYFARMASHKTELASQLSIGILLACGTMVPRMVLIASLLNPELFMLLLVPAIVMTVLPCLPALFYWHAQSKSKVDNDHAVHLKNPLEIKAALAFGLLLALVMFLSQALQSNFGEASILVLSATSGLVDMNAITLSLAQMSQRDLISLPIVVTGIIIAAAVNTIVKGGMATAIGGRKIGLRVGLPLLGSAVGGLVSVWLTTS